MPDTKKSAKPTTSVNRAGDQWTAEELAAMKEHAKELKAAARRKGAKEDGEADVMAKIAELPEPDRTIAKRLHDLIKTTAPGLSPKTYYGMPAYANEEGKVVCFFQPASKFKARYGTLGFNDDAMLDAGTMWPTSWALTKLTAADEAKIAELVKKAVS